MLKGPHGAWSYETPNWADCFPTQWVIHTVMVVYLKSPYNSLNLAFHVGMSLSMFVKTVLLLLNI